MKIIGLTEKGYLCEMMPREINCLADNINHSYRERQVNREFNIYEAWSNLTNLRTHLENLHEQAGNLRAVAMLLEPIVCEVIKTVEGEEKGEQA